ncbi:MAG: helix-turn-helix domain-containing protein [Candidatus Doudnabacteria bacterium]|nr:helix-turn-helix domain-containing protein [Candidatus Doudnabacteria bacterium]
MPTQRTSLGDLLRREREKQQLTTAQVAKKTFIRAEAIEALEAGNYEFFGSPVYVNGIMKSYATFLRADLDKVAALYRRDTATAKKAAIQETKSAPKTFIPTSFIYSRKGLTAIGLGLLLVIGAAFILNQVQALLTPPQLTITVPQELAADYTGELLISGNSFQLKGRTSPRTVVRFGGEVLEVDLDNTFATPEIPLAGDEFLATLTATNQLGRTATINLTIRKAGSSVIKVDKLSALIEVRDATTQVLIRTDGKIQFDDRLLPSEVISVEATTRIQIETADPQRLRIRINGTDYTTSALSTSWEIVEGSVVQK